MAPSAPLPGLRLFAAGAGFVLGAALQLQQPVLWPAADYAALLGLGAALLLAGVALGLQEPARGAAAATPAALLIAGALLACGGAGLRAGVRLADRLAPALEGQDVAVVGVVDGLPQRGPQGWRLRLEVESARLGDRAVRLPARLAIGWYVQAGRTPPELPTVRAGERWALTLRLKRPHGLANPHGYDYELALFEQEIGATGYVRTAQGAANHRLGDAAGHPVDRLRQRVRDAIEAMVDDAQAAGVLAALAVGDQAAIERAGWSLYRQTGIAHLMSISGLHVTMFAWLAGWIVGAGWRRSTALIARCPAPRAALWGGLAAATAYAVFAGWGVPAQRTLLMLATVTAVGALGLRWRWPLVWGTAMVVVTAIDPWALLQPGFWLSFVAVGLLLASSEAHAPPSARSRAGADPGPRRLVAAAGRGVRTQAVASLGLAPLSGVFFQQISVVGFAANLVAIPLVTLLVTPLALLGVLLPPLWTLAAALVAALNALLRLLAAPDWAVWSVAAAPAWAVACGLVGATVAMLPLPVGVRLLGVPLLWPLLAPLLPRPPAGAFELQAIDVGQGTAVLLRTAHHTLLYDAGPQYSRDSDAGERVLLPLLRAQGEARLDRLMLSHRDSDHVGGAAALLRGMPVAVLSSSLEAAHPLLSLAREHGARVEPCHAGQAWDWDGVRFELLHPSADALARAASVPPKPNTLSCVLRISGRFGTTERHVLLTGDLEREQENRLVGALGAGLSSDVLLVPHHGSKTSSSAAFLDAVAPRVAVVQAGYRNRFGHPAAEVMARYAQRDIAVVSSPDCGAWRYGPDGAGCWREAAPRYWQAGTPDRARGDDNGAEVADSAEPESAD